eukprot:gene29657-36951_t
MGLLLLLACGSVVAENVAAIHGGGVYAYDAEVTVLDSTLANNTAQAEGGHGYIVRGSRMDMAGCVLKGGVANWGGALSVRTDSVAVVDATSLEGNSAAVGGGGVVVSHNSHLVLNTSWVTQHTAEHRAGGAVYLYNATMHSVALSGNQGHHGTVYIGQPGALTEPAVLQELHFGNASMPIAGCVFSTFQPGVDPPECVNCTHNAATPLHVTTPASYKLTQADQVVTEVNLASNTSVLGVIAGENLETLTPAVHYVATDYYGQVCLPSSVTTVTAQMDAGLIAGGNARVVSGSLEMYGREGAVFDDMMLAGLAGGSYLVHFVPVESEWAGLALEVAIAPCESGDYYDGTSFTCKQCEAGTLKFANDEEPCVSCEGRNVTCPGGDAFVLEDGYWLANAAVRADCLVNDTECVLEK